MLNTSATGHAEGLGLVYTSGERALPTTRLGLLVSCVAGSASTVGSGCGAGGLGLGEIGGDLTLVGVAFRVLVMLPFTVVGLGGLPSRGWLDGVLEGDVRPTELAASCDAVVSPAIIGLPRTWLAAAGAPPSAP